MDELEEYQSRERVRAGRIVEIQPDETVETGAALLLEGGQSVHVDHAWMIRNNPRSGGWYADLNEDDRSWFIAAPAFEKQYRLVSELEAAAAAAVATYQTRTTPVERTDGPMNRGGDMELGEVDGPPTDWGN